MIDAMPSAPALPLGLTVCSAHDERHRLGLPMKAYLMSLPAMVPSVCQPQYWLENPELAVTSALVSTKYTAFVFFGSRPELIAFATIDWMLASESEVPKL